MKKRIITILLVITCVMFISPINTNALGLNSVDIVEKNDFNLLSKTVYIGATCNDKSNALLGDPNCEDSVAWLVQLILNIIKVVGPILVILLSSVDFIVVIIKSDNDQFQKAQKKLITRLILALLLFLVPTIVQILLQIFGISGSSTAGLK